MFVLTSLLPPRDPAPSPAPVPGQRFWDLSTGSRIAYVRLSAQGTAAATPIVFLHGGPGVPDMQGDAAYFGQLTADGFDVYVYDQVGSGRSSRLADPRGYTIARQVDDLEAIRGLIGVDKMLLIGHSAGGPIVASYMARHPEHVAAAVFSSPGALPGTRDTSAGGLTGRLDTADRLRLYALLLRPRALLTYGLLQVNPRAAYAFAGDREMDARFDRVYNRSRPALHCRGLPPGPALHGLGFYANQFPQSAAHEPDPNPRPALAGQNTPALIIKGSCDYLSWSSALAYGQALPQSKLVYLSGAGHNAYQVKPVVFLACVRAFLTGRPLPFAPVEGTAVPSDFEGPP
jgi:proline iminopeptidase